MENIYKNKAIVNPLFTGRIHASNHVSLTGTQYVELPILNNGGANSYATYYNVGLKQFSPLTLPISTTFKMETSFSQYFTHTSPLSQEDLDALNNNPTLIANVWGDGYVLPSGFSKSDMVDYISASEGLIAGATLTNIKDNSTLAIQDYTDECRTTYQNTTFGVNNLALIQDASGRMIDIAKDKTANFENAQGETIETEFMPNLDTYSIQYTIEGELKNFSAEMNVDFSFNDPSKWDTSTGGAFSVVGGQAVSDGSADSRIRQSTEPFIEVGKTYKATVDIAEMSDGGNISIIIGTDQSPFIVTAGIYTVYLTALSVIPVWMSQVRVLIGTTCKINSYSVKEVLTPTQRTETRLLTHTNTEDKYYIDNIEQPYTPALPDANTVIELNDTALIGYPDKVGSLYPGFKVWTTVKDETDRTALFEAYIIENGWELRDENNDILRDELGNILINYEG